MSVRVLFVCMGNICRSPPAHALFRQQVDEAGLGDSMTIDSAGTHAYHVGNAPDARATSTALRRGIDMTDLRARQIALDDFTCFDYILAMDSDNLSAMETLCPAAERPRLSLMLDWTSGWGKEVPDPYYGGDEGFERVFDMLADACRGLLEQIVTDHALPDIGQID